MFFCDWMIDENCWLLNIAMFELDDGVIELCSEFREFYVVGLWAHSLTVDDYQG